MKFPDQPLVSIVIPAYNQAKYIDDCLSCVTNQNYPNLEILVIDDVSTDDTAQKVQQWSQKDRRIRLFTNKKNLGATGSRNTGISKAKGKYIAFMDSDDLWHEDKISLQVTLLEENPDLGLVYAHARVVSEDKKPIRQVKAQLKGDAFASLIKGMTIAGSNSSVMVPATVLRKVGVYNQSLPYTGDWDLWLRIAREYPIDYVSQFVVSIRIHSQSLGTNQEKFLYNHLRFYRLVPSYILHNQGLNASEKIKCLRALGVNVYETLHQLVSYKRRQLIKHLKSS